MTLPQASDRDRDGDRTSEPTDAELIAASGDNPRAFMPLVERHQRVLFGYLARRIGPDIAEDIVAETFTRAFTQRDRFDPRWQDARPWLFGIALNLMRHHLRSEARQLRAYARSGVDPVLHNDDEAIARVDAGAMGPAVAKGLAGLTRGDRDVLLLFAWADMSYEQIATTLDVPVGTVRSRLNRARRQMQASLAEDHLAAAAGADSMSHRGGGSRIAGDDERTGGGQP